MAGVPFPAFLFNLAQWCVAAHFLLHTPCSSGGRAILPHLSGFPCQYRRRVVNAKFTTSDEQLYYTTFARVCKAFMRIVPVNVGVSRALCALAAVLLCCERLQAPGALLPFLVVYARQCPQLNATGKVPPIRRQAVAERVRRVVVPVYLPQPYAHSAAP